MLIQLEVKPDIVLFCRYGTLPWLRHLLQRCASAYLPALDFDKVGNLTPPPPLNPKHILHSSYEQAFNPQDFKQFLDICFYKCFCNKKLCICLKSGSYWESATAIQACKEYHCGGAIVLEQCDRAPRQCLIGPNTWDWDQNILSTVWWMHEHVLASV